MTGTASCDNDKFLTVDHYSILDENSGYDNDDHVLRSLNGCYDSMLPSEDDFDGGNADPFKPYIFTGCHPTMDTQATGWDKAFMTQSWTADTSELADAWSYAYNGITRCNDFLQSLADNADNISEDVYKTCEGEARVIRAFHYFWLATTFGRVPMLATGENFSNTPYKARAETYEEMWDFIIEDLEAAAELLTWKPYDNEYGRCTKGMALAYLGDAYMWKAYRCSDQATTCYQKAESALKQVLDCGEYELNPSFTTLWDATGVWGKECIYEQVLNEGSSWSSWDSNTLSGANGWTIYYSAAPADGGWGTIALSWELYDCFEAGDRRRDGSMVTAGVATSTMKDEKWQSTLPMQQEWRDDSGNAEYVKIWESYNTTNGYNPFVQEYVAHNNYHYDTGGEYAPAVYTTKFWRLGRCHWNSDQWAPAQIYRKRLPNVMLDYAECRFILYGDDDSQAWDQINTLRNRAFGNLEVSQASSLTSTYGSYYWNEMASFYGDGGYGNYVVTSDYPYPFATETVDVPDAKTYYTQLKAEKGFTSAVWKVAVNEERRKEFSVEWCLCPDMIKSGFIEEHVNVNYPKHAEPSTAAEALADWQTARTFDFDINRMDMPIPTTELTRNPLCDQNDAYK